jgi:hypothetical protein
MPEPDAGPVFGILSIVLLVFLFDSQARTTGRRVASGAGEALSILP